MKKVLFLIVAVLLVSSSAIAVPSLQLYIDDPDAWYDYGTDTWMTSSSDFDLWVIADDLLYQSGGRSGPRHRPEFGVVVHHS